MLLMLLGRLVAKIDYILAAAYLCSLFVFFRCQGFQGQLVFQDGKVLGFYLRIVLHNCSSFFYSGRHLRRLHHGSTKYALQHLLIVLAAGVKIFRVIAGTSAKNAWRWQHMER